MPLFTKPEMNKFIENSGKRLGSGHHSVPATSWKKGKTFLEDEYIKNIECTSDENYFYFRCRCYHSFRDSPKCRFYNEVLQFFLVLVDGACEAKFANETSRDKLLYIKPLFCLSSNSFLHITWVKCKEHTFVASVSLKCGPTSRHIFTSRSCRRFWSFGKPKNPTRFPSGSTVPFCVQPGKPQ